MWTGELVQISESSYGFCYCQYQCSTAPWKPPHFSVTTSYAGMAWEDTKAIEQRKQNEIVKARGQHRTEQALATSVVFWVMEISIAYGLFPYKLMPLDSSMHATHFPQFQTLKAKLWNENRNPASRRDYSQTTHPFNKVPISGACFHCSSLHSL